MAKFKASAHARMNDLPRAKVLAACIGVALAQWGTSGAYADSAVGVDTALGNAFNPPGRSAVPRPVAADGYDTVRHSPSGQLYGLPYDQPQESSKTEGGWEYNGGIEAGALGGNGNTKNALFRQYKDPKNGGYLNYFEVEAEKADNARFIQAFGGGAGQSDQFYGMQFGRYNDWKVRLFYNETLHVFSDNWKSLFNGEGTGNLTLSGPGLSGPTRVTTGSPTFGTGACTAAAPCWRYTDANGTTNVFSNASALNAIKGIAGTYGGAAGTTLLANSAQSNQADAIARKLAGTSETEMSLVRKKGGVRFDMSLTDAWKGYASYSMEKREGKRPFAMNEGNVSTEIAEPIDYDTHEFLAGLSYADSLTQANLRTSVSLFRNNISTLNVQYPFLSAATPNGALQTATYDLYPDNDAFNLKGEFARNFPDFYKARFTAVASWGTNRQNDDLLAPLSAAQSGQLNAAGVTTWTGNNAGFAANTGLISNWNTTDALSQKTAKQRIDNKLIDLGLSFRPIDDLSVKGSVRSFETDNKGGYTAYNPLTGQFGRGIADGNGVGNLDLVVGLAPGRALNTAGNCYVPPGAATNATIAACTFALANAITSGANVPVFGQARSTKQDNFALSGDYDLTRFSSINASLEREEFKRNFREREKTWEDKIKVGYVNRALGDTTVRASFETDRKRGSDYRFRTFEDLGTGLPGLDPATILAQAQNAASPYRAIATTAGTWNRYSYYFRKYDQADRDQNIFNARVNYMAREDLDMGLTLQAKNVKYPDSFYGMEKDNQNSVTLDVNFQPSSGQLFYAFYSLQQAKKTMNMNSGVAGANACTWANITVYGISACSDTVTGLDGTRPNTSSWSSKTLDSNDVFGLGFQSDIGMVRFGMDYTYANSKTKINYDYGSTAFSATGSAQIAAAAIAGSALPNMTFVQHTVNLNLLIPVSKRMAVRVFDRFETGKLKDWHYDNVIKNAVANYDSGTLLLDGGYQNYNTNIVGVFLQYKL